MARKNFIASLLLVILSAFSFAGAKSGTPPAAKPTLPKGMASYPTKYYQLYTDLPEDKVYEAGRRLSVMAELYYQRTRSFGGVINKRLPFYMFSNSKDYLAAGGVPGSAGVYRGSSSSNGGKDGRLMAIFKGDSSWRTVQHEGFHQFVHMAIGGRIPVWANEGLAEYYGCAVFTGDTMVTGLIPSSRHRKVIGCIKSGKLRPLSSLIQMDSNAWRAKITPQNYDHAWSLMHFLAHGNDNAYRGKLGAFISKCAATGNWKASWYSSFGKNVDKLDEEYRDWWLGLKSNPTADKYAETTLLKLTSFLARGTKLLKLEFKTPAEFFDAAKKGKLKLDVQQHKDKWLPPSLLSGALKEAGRYKWSMKAGPTGPKLVLELSDGRVIEGAHGFNSTRGFTTKAITKP